MRDTPATHTGRGFGFRRRSVLPGFGLSMGFTLFYMALLLLIPLGASGWQTFLRITLPNIRWGLIYGIVLTNARAMGEFGAVSVVSGHIRGKTNTLPLHIEVLYNDYQTTAAFAVASLLALLAVVTLVAKALMEWKTARRHALAAHDSEVTVGESVR